MDRTLKPGTGKNKRRRQRNGKAWQLFLPRRGDLSLLPPRRLPAPHLLGPAPLLPACHPEERHDPTVILYTHRTQGRCPILVRRVTVSKQAEVITAFCTPCAEALGTSQVLCYQRKLANGEMVGVGTHIRQQQEGVAA